MSKSQTVNDSLPQDQQNLVNPTHEQIIALIGNKDYKVINFDDPTWVQTLFGKDSKES